MHQIRLPSWDAACMARRAQLFGGAHLKSQRIHSRKARIACSRTPCTIALKTEPLLLSAVEPTGMCRHSGKRLHRKAVIPVMLPN